MIPRGAAGVVSEWFERGPSENNAIGGQVVASFILTSGGVPSGYVLAAYDLAGGAVSVTASAVQTTSLLRIGHAGLPGLIRKSQALASFGFVNSLLSSSLRKL